MNEVKLPFGMRADDGRIVSVDTVIRGLDCDCICPECKVRLIAVKGEIVRHHFRHYTEDGQCSGGRETALHKFAKQVICEELRLDLPDKFDCGAMNSAEQEVWLDGLKPDVLAQYDSEPIAIEVYVFHRVPRSKVDLLHERELCTMEIDLHLHWDALDPDEKRLTDEVLSRAPRRWIYEPRSIREKRAADSAALKEAARLAAIAAAERAEEEAVAAEKELELKREAKRIADLEAAARAETAERTREEERRLEAERQKALEVERKLRRDAWELEQAERRAEIARIAAEKAEREWKERERLAKLEALREARLAQVKAERQPPDLQQLVLAHGTYDKIPEDAWQRFHRDMASWKARIRHGDSYWELAQLKV